jgi:hypothetical protein
MAFVPTAAIPHPSLVSMAVVSALLQEEATLTDRTQDGHKNPALQL